MSKQFMCCVFSVPTHPVLLTWSQLMFGNVSMNVHSYTIVFVISMCTSALVIVAESSIAVAIEYMDNILVIIKTLVKLIYY